MTFKKFAAFAAACTISLSAIPAMSQDGAEEARTTYRITFVKVTPGSDNRFVELEDTYGNPAREAAGMPTRQLHWVMTGEYDFLLITEMPGGMAVLDTHNNPAGAAFNAKIVELAGSEEAAKKVTAEYQGILVKTETLYTHTHP